MAERKRLRIQPADLLYLVALVCLVAGVFLAARRSKVGVVDFAKVAAEVGFEEQLALNSVRWRNEAAAKSQELVAEFQETRIALQEEMASAGTEDEKTEFQVDLAARQRRLEGSLRQISREIVEQGQQQVMEFRKRLSPIIGDIARKKRMDIVVDSSSSSMLYCNGKVDMTAAVVDAATEAFAGEAGGGGEQADGNVDGLSDPPPEVTIAP